MKKLYGADSNFVYRPLIGTDSDDNDVRDSSQENQELQEGRNRKDADTVSESDKSEQHTEQSPRVSEKPRKRYKNVADSSSVDVSLHEGKQDSPGTDVQKNKRGSRKGKETLGRNSQGTSEEERAQTSIANRTRGEWEITDRILGATHIIGTPVPIPNTFNLVDIVIGDKIYTVSESSIRDGNYIQGLDSNFLINYYRPYKPKYSATKMSQKGCKETPQTP